MTNRRASAQSSNDHTHYPYNNPYDTSWVNNLVEVDDLIKEYLLFRGYHKTWDQFYRERKKDATKNKNIGGYQVDLIVDQLIGYIRNLRLSEYLDFWNTLNERIFNKLPPQHRESLYHLDTALKRYYLITARKRNNLVAIQNFFNKFGDSLIQRPDASDWLKWFILAHIKHPEQHQEFEAYFNKQWSYSVVISLKNFLSTALCRFPRPKILAFMVLKQERQEFKRTIEKLTEKLNDADFIIRSLHQQLTQLTRTRRQQKQKQKQKQELMHDRDRSTTVVASSDSNDSQDDGDEEEEDYGTNQLIKKAIQEYQSNNIHGGVAIISERNDEDNQDGSLNQHQQHGHGHAHGHGNPVTSSRANHSQSSPSLRTAARVPSVAAATTAKATQQKNKDSDAALQIHEKYFKSNASPQIVGMQMQTQRLTTIVDGDKASKTTSVHHIGNSDDVKSFNDSILFENARAMTPTRTLKDHKDSSKDGNAGSKSVGGALWKLGWFRPKNADDLKEKEEEEAVNNTAQQPQLLMQTEGSETPNVINPASPKRSLSMSSNSGFHTLPPLLQPQTATPAASAGGKHAMAMKTIFVPGVPINSVKFNQSGRRVAYSTGAGVIQIYQFPPTMTTTQMDDVKDKEEEQAAVTQLTAAAADTPKKERKLSPKLLHTFCVSPPNEILQLCWDSRDENRLFIAIGNRHKHDDHVQIWNVDEKQRECVIPFGVSHVDYAHIECIKCSPSSPRLSTKQRNGVLVCGVDDNASPSPSSMLFVYNQRGHEWRLSAHSSAIATRVSCLEYNHNGNILMVGGEDGVIRLFDVQNLGFALLTQWDAHYARIQTISLCEDANSILSLGADFMVKHWPLHTDDHSCKKVWKLWHGASDDAGGGTGASDATEERVVPLLCVGPTNLFAVTQPNPVRTESGANSSTMQNEDNTGDSHTQLYNVAIKNIEREHEQNEHDIVIGGHSKIITAVDWHKDTQMLATCSTDGTLRIFA